MGDWIRAQLQGLTAMEPKDWLALLLAALALIISFVVAGYTVRSERKMAKLATYERLHEQLVSPETATGRRALFVHGPSSQFPSPRSAQHDEHCDCGQDPDLWDVINQSIAWYDTLATYYMRGQIPRPTAMRAWYHPLIAIRPFIYRFLDHRARHGIEQPWDALQALLEETLWYSCNCRTCSGGSRPAPQDQPTKYYCVCTTCKHAKRIHPPIETKRPARIRAAEYLHKFRGRHPAWAGLLL